MFFLKLFFDGKYIYIMNNLMKIKLILKKYINFRLFFKDGRFVESLEYIFMVLDWLEWDVIK